jgi:hypothetical protein
MPRPSLRIRLAVCLVALAAGLWSTTTATAGASPAHRCRSADLRYPFEPGGPKTFGVFRLRITGGRCATAHRVAKIWMEKLEASIHGPGPLKVPRSAGGFSFKTLRPTAAQTYNERGRRRTTTIRFDYVVPNG